MSQQIFIQGYSEYELQALKIPNQVRGQCLKQYVPYVKCMQNADYIPRWLGQACQDQRYTYSHCRKIQRQRSNFAHLMAMKLNNPKKFQQLNVAPALDTEYGPSILNLTRH